jgi:hypothetical protein
VLGNFSYVAMVTKITTVTATAHTIDKRVNGIGNATREPIVTIEKFADKAC